MLKRIERIQATANMCVFWILLRLVDIKFDKGKQIAFDEKEKEDMKQPSCFHLSDYLVTIHSCHHQGVRAKVGSHHEEILHQFASHVASVEFRESKSPDKFRQ